MMLALLDVAAEHTVDYNRWYDLDHMPEHLAKPDVLTGRRYAAPRDLRAVPGAVRSELIGGHPSYLTCGTTRGGGSPRRGPARAAWCVLSPCPTWRTGE